MLSRGVSTWKEAFSVLSVGFLEDIDLDVCVCFPTSCSTGTLSYLCCLILRKSSAGGLYTAPEHRHPLSFLTGPSAAAHHVFPFGCSYWFHPVWISRSTQVLLCSFQPLQTLKVFSTSDRIRTTLSLPPKNMELE